MWKSSCTPGLFELPDASPLVQPRLFHALIAASSPGCDWQHVGDIPSGQIRRSMNKPVCEERGRESGQTPEWQLQDLKLKESDLAQMDVVVL